MKMLLASIAALSFAGTAIAQEPQRVEIGYSEGALGLAAIERGDWATAERQLTEARLARADDPARLINLGRVYAATGRVPQALAAWHAALASRRQHDVVLGDGSVASTDAIARAAIARHALASANN